MKRDVMVRRVADAAHRNPAMERRFLCLFEDEQINVIVVCGLPYAYEPRRMIFYGRYSFFSRVTISSITRRARDSAMVLAHLCQHYTTHLLSYQKEPQCYTRAKWTVKTTARMMRTVPMVIPIPTFTDHGS